MINKTILLQNEDQVSEIYQDTAVEMFKPNYHNGVQDKPLYDSVDHTVPFKAASNNANNVYETTVQQSNSITSGAPSNSTTPSVGMVYEVDVSIQLQLVEGLEIFFLYSRPK